MMTHVRARSDHGPILPPAPAPAVWILCGLGILFTIAAEVLAFPTRDAVAEALFIPAGLIFLVVGVMIARRRPENPIGWILCTAGLMSAVQSFGEEYGIYSFSVDPLPAATWVAWAGNAVYALWLVAPISFVFLLFPTGHLPSRRWRPLAWLAAAVIAGWTVYLAFGVATLSNDPLIRNPARIVAVTRFFAAIGLVSAVLIPVIVLGPALSLIARFRRSQGIERLQLKWVAYWAALEVVAFLVAGTMAQIYGAEDSGLLGAIAWYTTVFGLALGLPLVIAIAILRYRLWEIDVLINRTLVYVPLTALVAGLYTASIGLFQRLFTSATGSSSISAIVLTTLVVAAAFTPIKNHLQVLVDRYFKPDPAAGQCNPAHTPGAALDLIEQLRREVASLREELTTNVNANATTTAHTHVRSHGEDWRQPDTRDQQAPELRPSPPPSNR
jgi:hypothetical protein